MKKCLSCGVGFDSKMFNCPSCNWQPIEKNNILSYAPALADNAIGFKPAYFSDLIKLEEASFWFRFRNQLILWVLQKYCFSFGSFLEIGCGTGYVLSGIAKRFTTVKLFGSEIFMAGLDLALGRLPSANLMQMDARHIPFSEEFDVIGAFDVLEHIEDDELVLSQIHAALKPQGYAVITVPQHPWLWSYVDEYACHVRRYTSKELHQKISAAGFDIVRSTSFITTLLPAMMISRFFQKPNSKVNIDPTSELRISPWLNCLLDLILSTELFLIKCGINLPIGGSRLVVAKKHAMNHL